MPDQHAHLSPSSAERWITCPASVQASAQLALSPESESVFALEGTIAHELGELKASLAFGKIDQETFRHRRRFWHKKYADVVDEGETEIEMERHTDAYVDFIRERVAAYPHSQVLFEQRLDAGVPECWGTSDTVIVSPVHVEIIDLKYGQGIFVSATKNPQLRLYACGALDTFGDILGDTETVRTTVFQPRMDNVSWEEMTADELREWRTSVAVAAAEEALGPDPHFQPSDEACRWCPLSGRCRAQLEAVFAEPFVLPAVLDPAEVARTLGRVPQVREWLKAFEEMALTMAYSEGQDIPGYKVVMSGGQRSVQDANAAIDVLVEAGYDHPEILNTKIKGIGELEKLLGKTKFAELLESPGLVKKSEGKPALTTEDDPRPAVSPNSEAKKEFGA